MSMKPMAIMAALAVGLMAAISGCGGGGPMSDRAAKTTVGMAPRMAEAPPAAERAPADEAGEPVHADGGKDQAPPPLEKVKRKIKYTADIRLITDDFPKSEESLIELIEASKGFLAFADVSTIPGQPRRGTWRARVPVESFEAFRKGIAKIGEVESSKVNTEDVTAQFYDIENHIKNQKAQEDALRELLKKTTDKMENLLAVQRELSRVRDSIERSEGQLRLLANLTDLTTVTISIQERQKFVPEKPPERAEKPAFGTRASETFKESWTGVVNFVQDFAIAVVALTPWLPLVAGVAGVVWLVVRKKRRATPTVTPVEKT